MRGTGLRGPFALLAVSASVTLALLWVSAPGSTTGRAVDPVQVHRVDSTLRVAEVRVQPGDLVEAGQQLARLEDGDLLRQANLVRARLEGGAAAWEDHRAVETSQRSVDEGRLRADLDEERARIALLEEAIAVTQEAVALGWGDGERLASLRREHGALVARRAGQERALSALVSGVSALEVDPEQPVHRAELAHLEASIAQRTLRASAPGVVRSVVPVGHTVAPGEAIVTVGAREVDELVACVVGPRVPGVGSDAQARSSVDREVHVGRVRALLPAEPGSPLCRPGVQGAQLAYITLDAPARPGEPFQVAWGSAWW